MNWKLSALSLVWACLLVSCKSGSVAPADPKDSVNNNHFIPGVGNKYVVDWLAVDSNGTETPAGRNTLTLSVLDTAVGGRTRVTVFSVQSPVSGTNQSWLIYEPTGDVSVRNGGWLLLPFKTRQEYSKVVLDTIAQDSHSKISFQVSAPVQTEFPLGLKVLEAVRIDVTSDEQRFVGTQLTDRFQVSTRYTYIPSIGYFGSIESGSGDFEHPTSRTILRSYDVK